MSYEAFPIGQMTTRKGFCTASAIVARVSRESLMLAKDRARCLQPWLPNLPTSLHIVKYLAVATVAQHEAVRLMSAYVAHGLQFSSSYGTCGLKP